MLCVDTLDRHSLAMSLALGHAHGVKRFTVWVRLGKGGVYMHGYSSRLSLKSLW